MRRSTGCKRCNSFIDNNGSVYRSTDGTTFNKVSSDKVGHGLKYTLLDRMCGQLLVVMVFGEC